MRRPTFAFIQVTNVGPGTALNVNLDLALEARNPDLSEQRLWRANVMAPGEHQRFLPPSDENGNLLVILFFWNAAKFAWLATLSPFFLLAHRL